VRGPSATIKTHHNVGGLTPQPPAPHSHSIVAGGFELMS